LLFNFFFFNSSLISDSNVSVADGAAGAAGASSFSLNYSYPLPL
jgi:hypothetical protein